MPEAKQKSTNDTHPDLQIQTELMETLRGVVERRTTVQDLITKAKESQGKVKPAIYAKVIADYESRLVAVEGEYAPASEAVTRSLGTIKAKEIALRRRMEEIEDEIEEQRFRCEIGEFDPQYLEPIEKEKTSAVKELKAQIDVVDTTFDECRKLISAEDFASAMARTAEPSPAANADDQAGIRTQELDPNEVRTGPALPPPPPPDALEEEDVELTSPGMAPPSAAEPPATRVGRAPAALEPPSPAHAPAKVSGLKEGEPPEEEPPMAKEKSPPQAPPSDTSQTATPQEPKAAAEGQIAAIKVVKKNGKEEIILLREEILTIGRASSSDIQLKFSGVSRTHAQLVRTKQGDYGIVAMSASGELAVNGKSVKKARLRGGDKITIGPCQIEMVGP